MFPRITHRVSRFILVTLFLLAFPLPALADGIIIVDPPICLACPPTPFPVGGQLVVKYHRVTVAIENQIAVTKVDQMFYNPNDWAAEGTYVFPIPADATVSNFAMWVDGQKIEAKLLNAEEARQIYNDIVRKQRDPALLEYIGQGAVQASLFPIPPQGERRIQLEYSQVLPADNGLIHYRYPLNTEKFSAQPLESVSVSVSVTSAQAVRAVYSPTHKVAVDRPDKFHFTASYEESNVTPDHDFELFYSVSPSDIGVNLLSYRDPAGGDGFFVLLAAPGIETGGEVIAKDVLLVLDQSGSMDGTKIEQAKGALTYVLNHLNADDRFNIVAFSTGVQRFANDLQPAGHAGAAADWVSGLRAEGGTNIDRALLETLGTAQRDRPTIVIFLTDGLATDGVIESDRILADVNAAAPGNVRLFTFGVGDDVDTILLDSLAEANHGASAYVRPGERIDEAVSAFYAKVSTPVLADLSVDFGEALVSDTYPDPLPDLFAGSQLVLVGRYRNGGSATVTLRGTVNGAARAFEYGDQRFTDSGGDSFIPRLWATRKIGYLLNQIRLKGENPEWVKAIVDLSVRYGIVTPYTSYLITEGDVLTSAGREAITQGEVNRLEAAPAPSVGGGAVQTSQDQAALQGAESAAAPAGADANAVKIVGARAFVNVGGVWTDTQFDPSAMKTTKVQFGSDDYFALMGARPDLGAALALGQRVIVLSEGVAYEVVGESTPPLTIPPTVSPAATAPAAAMTPVLLGTPVPVSTQPTAAPTGSAGGAGGGCAAALIPFGVVGLIVWRRSPRGRRETAI